MKLCRKDMQERMFFLVGSIIPLSFLIHSLAPSVGTF